MNSEFYKAFEDKFRGTRDLIKTRLQVYKPFLLPLKETCTVSQAVDLGCGRGEWLELMEEIGFSVQGVDLDDGMLSECRSLGLRVQTLDALSFLKSLPDESQVVVSCFHLVEHVSFEYLQSLIEESLRVLCPAGILILETPNTENIVVGTSSFYLDPTHKQPIPSNLLAFLPEFYGFEKIKILRLQEASGIIKSTPLTLHAVLNGVSPDYAVISQKAAESGLLKLTSDAFDVEYGVSLDDLSAVYDRQVKFFISRIERVESDIQDIINSNSWKITAPLRSLKRWINSLFKKRFSSYLKFIYYHYISTTLEKCYFFVASIKMHVCLKVYKWSPLRRLVWGIRDLPLVNKLSSSVSINKYLVKGENKEKQLLVDVSDIFKNDIGTGIQRVVRAILTNMLGYADLGYKVRPIYFDGKFYRYTNKYRKKIVGEAASLDNKLININSGDIFFALDFSARTVARTHKLLRGFKKYQVEIYFLLHDILPMQYPEWFSNYANLRHEIWLREISEVASGIICVSQSVAEDVKQWLNKYEPEHVSLKVYSSHNGADIHSSLPTSGMPEGASDILKSISGSKSFLMVGTIEPRKGYAQVLKAFEQLWREGFDISLVIVGKKGWMLDKLYDDIIYHIELNEKLFFLEGISDEFLEKVYFESDCLIAASEGEGFGLPLIEAAQCDLPIIARDIPVFREVAGDHAFYFNSKNALGLALEIKEWIRLNVENKAPQSIDMPWLTWQQSTQNLLNIIIPESKKVRNGYTKK